MADYFLRHYTVILKYLKKAKAPIFSFICLITILIYNWYNDYIKLLLQFKSAGEQLNI